MTAGFPRLSWRPALPFSSLLFSDIGQPIVSQQLARLRASGIVIARNRGAATRYSVADPQLKDLLRVAKQILNRRLVGVQSLLRELEHDTPTRSRSRRTA